MYVYIVEIIIIHENGGKSCLPSLCLARISTGYHSQSYGEHLRRSRCLASALSRYGIGLED